MNLQFSRSTLLTVFAVTSIGYSQDVKEKKNVANIDLSHWSVTTPAEDPVKPGKTLDLSYPEILDFATNEATNKYMYEDKKDKSIVFYAFPSGTSTANSHFSRSELRETINIGDKDTNWTFAQGGNFKAKYAIESVSKESDGKYSRVIIAQIHGRLSDAQRDLIGQKDNNAAPILKIYWDKGKIRVKTKVLKNLNATEEELLPADAWKDDAGRDFKEKVDFNKFTIEVKVSDGRLEVILNDSESFVYNDINIKKWGVFENYFKAGNYFQSKDPKSFAKVKIYSLKASH
ncbi:polysaccharide lyase family 7 protein [Flavobacterium algicola]|uniref:polysaccharide lyase family 7 protein n=1 Tax=Flavobacterium algicola TaxID=556529 RepID=UPI001EFCFD99|nr:polysaccharide lyase family 7 protein [Flavobacterium algicola]MCG9791797.1 polysaccharide lyase family 7 protein [Flavobacterium algicola]